MSDTSFDLVILGAGPGGYVAAIRASQLGMKVAVVEREHLGGICLNWGCIPTKALLRSSEVGHILSKLDTFGYSAQNVSFDIKKVVARSRGVAKQLSGGVSHLLKKNKIKVIMGQGRLKKKQGDDLKITVSQENKKEVVLDANKVILATGARARSLPNIESDGKTIWTYKEAMVPNSLPKSILVIGSGAIGIEFASFYNDLGSNVTVIEVLDRILPAEDSEISLFAEKAFVKQGIKIKTATKVLSVEPHSRGAKVKIERSSGIEELEVEKVILAVGIVGNSDGIGLEDTNVEVTKGHVVADVWGATAEPGVYAIGDLSGPPWLAHKASHEGVLCVEHIAGIKGLHPLNTENIPGCTYSRPQIASVGLTQAAAEAAGHKIRAGHFPFIANGKAIALGEMEGFVKTIFDQKTGELLGAHMIGAEVTELIQGYTVAKTLETTEKELLHTVFPHPTLSEMMHESVLDAFDKAIHI
ncbi:MAG: dihydrolipoyl dehydrogenase [Rhodospirillaceae bacterium]|nr:dihydrolipoyl dehydrogenase [Rhodospirillaceae bacterium]|tara:strand:+ start:2315 stop:3727 length:1413 start_codon:yes stop_codon:yes gene_type:complete